jgi:starvation-inducible outer membrane lipoprotein
MIRTMLVLTLALPVAACVTTPETRARELAYCQRMEQEMGLTHVHDHGEAKGQGLNPMRVTHDRCRKLLGNS